jgi:predicted nuclease of predicted toxin-antitoxin system
VNDVLSARPDLKLLFDQNLPSRFITSLADLFPDSEHLRFIGLAAADDQTVWDYARENGFAIISKDSDFHQMSFLYGAPPKIVWLRCGNCSVVELEGVVRKNYSEISEFLKAVEGALLVVNAE